MVSWGVDSLGQTHGMGVYVPQSYFSNYLETEQNHVALLKSRNRKTVRFVFAAAWEKELGRPWPRPQVHAAGSQRRRRTHAA